MYGLTAEGVVERYFLMLMCALTNSKAMSVKFAMTTYCHKSYLNCVTPKSEVGSKGKRRIPECEMDARDWYARLKWYG